ncbi:HK97 family phage prohead protease [Blastochloris viridis]|uniref:Gene transfer agent prohead protease n=1 Tax=Blastochloris viridis TaxID=1079 RepID=A0A0H5BCJ9_BLAVI|nr:HK97 family phage prohead protease [Blastochloris viridis]ALK10128.1 Caudovirus prohead protease [Blastochloris viridis]BAR99942.1 gene transfer agent prohead protease [Blastochloris viridis]CUU42792.1 phage prohead protease, HK97 family [Blastochloris viridis]
MSDIIEGYASLFGRADLARDVVEAGAFGTALRRRGAGNIRMLWQHDPMQPIGVWLSIAEDGCGLYCRGRLVPDAAKSAEVAALLKAGALDGLSIGYRTVRARLDPVTRLRRLIEIDLWEISIVTFPLLPEARLRAKHLLFR